MPYLLYSTWQTEIESISRSMSLQRKLSISACLIQVLSSAISEEVINEGGYESVIGKKRLADLESTDMVVFREFYISLKIF